MHKNGNLSLIGSAFYLPSPLKRVIRISQCCDKKIIHTKNIKLGRHYEEENQLQIKKQVNTINTIIIRGLAPFRPLSLLSLSSLTH
jgi:hypothetical protein